MNDRLKEIAGDKDAADEIKVLKAWLELSAKEAELKKTLKEAEAALDAVAIAKYPKLTEVEIKTLVVDDKWLATLDARIHGEMDRVSQQLTTRVKELAERYEARLPDLARAHCDPNCGDRRAERRVRPDRRPRARSGFPRHSGEKSSG